jgi:hypothetical protein
VFVSSVQAGFSKERRQVGVELVQKRSRANPAAEEAPKQHRQDHRNKSRNQKGGVEIQSCRYLSQGSQWVAELEPPECAGPGVALYSVKIFCGVVHKWRG